MNLQYKGVNSRGRAEWVDLDLDGVAMEEWVLVRYRRFVEETEEAIGRALTKAELMTIHWLSGCDKSSLDNIMGIIKAAHMHGKSHR